MTSIDNSRDFSGEMSQLITDLLRESDTDIIPSVAATSLVEKLLKVDAGLLDGWLREHARVFLSEQIKHRLASARARARVNASKSAFAADARRFVGGDSQALSPWLNVRYAVDRDNTQRRLLDMNHDDLIFVATRYSRAAQSSLLEEAFLRALAARVGKKTVGEVFAEEEIDRMYSSIQGRTSTVAS